MNPHVLATWVNKIDGYYGSIRRLDPFELVSKVKKIALPRYFPANNLIHLPDKLEGVFDSLRLGS